MSCWEVNSGPLEEQLYWLSHLSSPWRIYFYYHFGDWEACDS